MTPQRVRPTAVAGSFYPERAAVLERAVRDWLASARAVSREPPKALIAPHAGYIYSGAVAASAYAQLAAARERVARVVLLGPAHRAAVLGLAAPACEAFETPLGAVPVDRDALDDALALPQVRVSDAAHQLEHSLEVQLPFLQCALSEFSLVPLVVGDAVGDDVAQVLERLWGGDETLVVVSTDLSHYRDYDTAVRMDEATTRAIEALDPERIGFDQACGRIPVQGLLLAAGRRGLSARTLDLRNSGDTAGPRDSVVGYGAYAFA